MKIAFQMEPLEETESGVHTTLFLIQEACLRGHQTFHYLPESLSLGNKGVHARLAPVTVDMSQENHYDLGDYNSADLASFDAVFMRQYPPVDMGFITATYILERLKNKGVFVTNDPFWMRNTPDKLFIFDFEKYMPPTLVSRDIFAIKEFFQEYKDIVIKPLYSYNGYGILRSTSIQEIEEELNKSEEPLMFQPFLQEIREGRKRIVLFDGEIIGALKTVPQGEDFRVYRDSVDFPYELSEGELSMCTDIGKILKERELHFVGIDLIGSYLTEINTGSVGTLPHLNRVYNKKYESILWDFIERKLAS